jgi:uncharacterized paraquat-inducible protein A
LRSVFTPLRSSRSNENADVQNALDTLPSREYAADNQKKLMVLVQCHECGGQVSDHAKACPKCGAPVLARIRRQQKNVLIELGIRLVLAAVIGVTLWFTLGHIFKRAMAPLKAIEQKQKPPH